MEVIREIPEGWEEKEIKELFKVASGDLLISNDMMFGEYPVYGGNGICGYNNSYNSDTSKIIIGRVGVYCGCIYRTENKSWITDNALYIKNKLWNYQEEFMFYKLKHIDLNKYADKNAQPLISGSKIYGIKLEIPKSKQEQQKISKILSILDQNIEKTKQTIKKYKNIKNSLMDDLLTGKRRIKDGTWVEETEFKDVEDVGKVPKDWETASIQDIGIEIIDGDRGKNYPNGDELSKIGDCVFLNNKNISMGKIVYGDCDYISYDKDNLLRNGKLKQNDIIITTRGTIGNIAIYLEKNTYPNVRINSGMVILRNYGEKFNSYFLINYWFYIFKRIYYIIGSGSAQPQLPIKDLKQINLIIPELKEQKNIVAVLSKQDQLIEKEQQYLQKLKSLKSGLMEDLLTGKVRIKLSN